MRTVILSPHHDDVALFTAFNAIRHHAHIIVVFRSVKQEVDGITDKMRCREEMDAARELDCTVEFWDYPDTGADGWDPIVESIRTVQCDLLFAPASEEEGGNVQHDVVGATAASTHENVVRYLTYTTEGKSTWGRPVEFELAWVPMKLRALACHVSQASHPLCYPHFLRSQMEYTA